MLYLRFAVLFLLFQASCFANPLYADAKKNSTEQLKKYIKYDPSGENHVGYITISGHNTAISDATWLYVKQALEYYKTTKPIFVILELNTPGGEVFAAQKISDALKDFDTQFDIPVVAFIDNWAISAGAMLAYSCRFIAVVKDASMGAAQPIEASQSGEVKEASEKINSALRADFASRAIFYNRNPYIAEAMVDKDVILVSRHGKIMKLDNESQIHYTGDDPDTIISAKGKLLTLGTELLMQYGVADIVLPPAKLVPITDEEKNSGKWPASKMLLFEDPFFKQIPNASIDTYLMDWKTKFFVFLANPFVASLLFLGLMLSIYAEMSTPGFGFAATVGIVCLFFIILSSFSLDIASWLEIILLLAGITAILVDLYIVPTFGLFGFIGVILTLAGLFGLMLPGIGSIKYDFDTHTINSAGDAFFDRLALLCGTMLIGIAIMLFLARYISPSFSVFHRLVLKGNEQDVSRGYVAGVDVKRLPKIGSKGEALTPLRISGKILIDGNIYDAISTGAFIEKGARVAVVAIDTGSVVVDQCL